MRACWRVDADVRRFAFILMMTLTLCWLAVGGVMAARVATVTLRSESVVLGGDLLLGQIAEIETVEAALRQQLEGLYVGRAAVPGEVRLLLAGSVRVRIRQAGFADQDVVLEGETGTIRVRTASSPVEVRGAVDALAGSEVEVVCVSGAVRVSDVGLLQRDAYVGDRVNVTNMRTGKAVSGILVTPTLVQVGS